MVFSRLASIVRSLLVTSLIIVASLPALGQYRVAPYLLKQGVHSEALFLLSSADSLRDVSAASDTVQLRAKSPTTAVLLSAVLPGAGQIYTQRYWKVPIIVGFCGYFVYQWTKANDRYLSARSKYTQSVERGESGGQGSAQFLYERDFYRDERDKFAFYFALTYLLNIIDAYVGASLYTFDVGDNLGTGAVVRLSIPFR
ncbi:MAG: hypothetical protein FJ217_06420 [Ignavibacteria bacterium]|nr:hypothetical protein [Ignavibacteria bacterium]